MVTGNITCLLKWLDNIISHDEYQNFYKSGGKKSIIRIIDNYAYYVTWSNTNIPTTLHLKRSVSTGVYGNE